ncbi:MAG: UDP-2,3-diacylglucosamine diphosphatase LpxI [Rhodobacteraceae bacterium]|nr:UDP-2,3-diacylglucosamine diphosphatase LpxI [Paracoccaceae bacterium]
MSETLEGPLGVVAGAGALPRLVAEAERRHGGAAHIVALRGFAEDWVNGWPHTVAGVGQVGLVFSSLRRAGCTRVCLAGGLSRPVIWRLRPDLTGLKVAAEALQLLRKGDDGLLRGLAKIFEARGFRLIGAHELLEDLLAPAGALTEKQPGKHDLSDVARAAEIVEALGRVDVGQGAVVAHGRCLAVETVQGTDAMLAKLEGDDRRSGAPVPSGVLYKAPKPGQDKRMDLPAIGPRTVRLAKAAGLNGVVVKAGEVFLLDPAETAAAAREAGLFVYGYSGEGVA